MLCRTGSGTATTQTAADITDEDYIVTQFGKTASLRFHNVIFEQFNVNVRVNGSEVIKTPDTPTLASPFTVNLQDGDNVVRVRLASKDNQPHAGSYGLNAFYYKVKASDILVSNLGQDDDLLGAVITSTV